MSQRVDRCYYRLANRCIGVADQTDQRLKSSSVADLCQRAGGADHQLRILHQHSHKRLHRARVTYSAERDHRCLPRFQLLGFQLFDQQQGRLRSVPNQSFDDLPARSSPSEQSRQRSRDCLTFKPAQYQRVRAQVFVACLIQSIEQVMSPGGVDFPANQIRDERAFVV